MAYTSERTRITKMIHWVETVGFEPTPDKSDEISFSIKETWLISLKIKNYYLITLHSLWVKSPYTGAVTGFEPMNVDYISRYL